MIDEYLNHGGNEQHVGDAEPLYRLRHGFRRERLDDRVGAGIQ